MFDLEIRMADRPGELARMGAALGGAGVSVEGGGMFLMDGIGVAHFLVDEEQPAVAALTAGGLEVAACRKVLALRLNQDEPGQLGGITAAMADRGINIEVLYSDHGGQLVLLVDDGDTGAEVRDEWMGKRAPA